MSGAYNDPTFPATPEQKIIVVTALGVIRNAYQRYVQKSEEDAPDNEATLAERARLIEDYINVSGETPDEFVARLSMGKLGKMIIRLEMLKEAVAVLSTSQPVDVPDRILFTAEIFLRAGIDSMIASPRLEEHDSAHLKETLNLFGKALLYVMPRDFLLGDFDLLTDY